MNSIKISKDISNYETTFDVQDTISYEKLEHFVVSTDELDEQLRRLKLTYKDNQVILFTY